MQDGSDFEYYKFLEGETFEESKTIYVPVENVGVYDRSVVPYIEVIFCSFIKIHFKIHFNIQKYLLIK